MHTPRVARAAFLLCSLLIVVLSVFHGRLEAATVAPQLSCPSCEDYNYCTIDSCDPATGTCRHDPLSCDDGNACTKDVCTPYNYSGVLNFKACSYTFLASGSACDDGNPCTADACDGAGHCVASPQPAGAPCDDGNPCTAGDLCSATGTCSGAPLAEGAECDDRNSCTRGERCATAPDGSISCQAPVRSCDDGLLCTTDSCDPITGDCRNIPVNCDDGNPCTVDACAPESGTCTHTIRTGSCDDKNICTTNDACVDGNCVGGGVGTCGWGNQCGSSFCLPYEQRCLTSPSTTGCPPPGQCYRFDCFNGTCRSVSSNDGGSCSTGNPCLLGRCVRGGCMPSLTLPDGYACNDGTACTGGETCQHGTCTGTPVCTDGDACTDDQCDASTGACLGHTAKNCDDGNPCTTDACDPAIGCTHVPNSNACDDQNACTTGDTCTNGQCRGTIAVTCSEDNNPCTTNQCDPATGGCVVINNFASCDDGNSCTVGDFCQNGSCRSGSMLNCDDSNTCTADSCSTLTGACVHAPIDGPCSDGNACTADDMCVAGVCRPGPPLSCDDHNPCTADGCTQFQGCYHTVLTGPCDDGNPCTTGDACLNGVCTPSAPVSCTDGNACTTDYCDRSTGACVHQASGAGCDDGDACTVDQCDPATGACLAHLPLDCDDGNACTSDACDTASGCTHTLTCAQDVVDLSIAFDNPIGKGSGTLRWRTTAEATLSGFNVLTYDQQGNPIQINAAPIPCTECVTSLGASYSYVIPKHRNGRNFFVQAMGRDGQALGTFGPAQKSP